MRIACECVVSLFGFVYNVLSRWALYEVSPLISLCERDLDTLRAQCTRRRALLDILPLQIEPQRHRPSKYVVCV